MYTQPLPHHIGSDTSPQQLPSQIERLAQDLAKVELERDRCKYEVEQKQQRLQEYEEQIAQYKTKPLYSGGQHSVVDHYETRIKELEDNLTKHKCDIVTKDAKIKQLQDQLENEKERSTMKQSQDTNERKLKQNMAKLQSELDQARATKSVTDTQLKSIRKKYDEQKQQFQQLNEEFGRTKKQLELKEEDFEKMEEVKSKLKAEITTLEQTLEKNKEYLSISQAKTKHLQHQFDKKDQEYDNLKNDLMREKERIKKLEKEVQSLMVENQQTELKMTTRIDAMEEEHKKQVYELTTTRDEKTQLAADHEEKIIQLEQQLKEAHNLIEQVTQEKAKLETELQSQQVRFASVIVTTHILFVYMYIIHVYVYIYTISKS